MPPRALFSSRTLRSTPVEQYVCPSCRNRQITRRPKSKSANQKISIGIRSYATAATEQRYRWDTYEPRSGHLVQQRRGKTDYIAHENQRGEHEQSNTSDDSVASSTAINAPSTVPPPLRRLYQQLQQLQDKATSYVDLSRLQLALRSLESKEPIIRIAFLGVGQRGSRAARKLAKVLLADELGDEADWEKDLLRLEDGRNVLLRYGEPDQDMGVQRSSTSLIHEMKVPSRRLQRWNIEILVAGLNASSYTALGTAESLQELEESILVPPLTIPGASRRVGFVRYPVHKALILADGISGAVDFGRLPSSLAEGKLISSALSFPPQARPSKIASEGDGGLLAISIDQAEHALELFRSSNANGAIYSEQWQRSRVGKVSAWLSAASQHVDEGGQLLPAVDDLLGSVLSRTDSAVSLAEASLQASSNSLDVPDANRVALQSAIATWSEDAHRDLQVNLAEALNSSTWRRTTWWRLFWRIDEVSISAGDVLRRGWLIESEQNLAFVSGRILEAGLASAEQLKNEPASTSSEEGTLETGLLPGPMGRAVGNYKATQSETVPLRRTQSVTELLQVPMTLAKVKEQSGLDAMFDPPWPQTINLARLQMLYRTVPVMHRKAQALMLTSLSTIGGSGALAGWLWVASGGIALYEAGAIAALGLVWALRRLQTKWSVEREKFTMAMKEDARRVLADIESRLKRLVQEGGRATVRREDATEWVEARAAIEACQSTKNLLARVRSTEV